MRAMQKKDDIALEKAACLAAKAAREAILPDVLATDTAAPYYRRPPPP